MQRKQKGLEVKRTELVVDAFSKHYRAARDGWLGRRTAVKSDGSERMYDSENDADIGATPVRLGWEKGGGGM